MPKILPFPEKPYFMAYQYRAFPIGVIQACSPVDITPWLCTKCVNCYYSSWFDCCMGDAWGADEQIVTQQTIYLKRTLLDYIHLDIVPLFRAAIDRNCYICGEYNEKYIPGKMVYNKIDFKHDYIIIGYDQDKFISAGYVANRKFELFDIPNENLIESLYNNPDEIFQLKIVNYNESVIPTPNIKRMIDELEAYISTENEISSLDKHDVHYGISAVNRLKDVFLDKVKGDNSTYIDLVLSRAFLEHEWIIMKLTENFLNSKHKEVYGKIASENYERAHQVHMLGIKMELTADVSIIDRITTLMDNIIYSELEYIPQLVKVLKDKYAEII